MVSEKVIAFSQRKCYHEFILRDWRNGLMTGVEIAALIAACAFLALVIFVIVKVSPILSRLNKTVDYVNDSLEIITKDVDSLSIEVEGLLNKANVLVDDVNGKLKKTDPLFQAAGELGVTISDVNTSSRSLATKAVKLSKKSRAVKAFSFGKSLFSKKIKVK